ncbi:MBOAT family protein [Chryseobacterium carnipullorum]|uniref:D-alanyl-lipoteichoic acid biosynthesis protein DltB n=1 Tax=Chryseobacterium carnipullorum TaxID=1124835 RepID=A0A376EL20_CHRCU|nr:MBOAT family O-acyltransferase [Chryseobacterium carnipullorum]AZA47495.1 MBOAT family protein [Chryseobacterium carnipullorum]STD10207.1 D-alanyl-lipoteichoic acid biosynthesis protein DltB [Chryseobacterium carnipullorum]
MQFTSIAFFLFFTGVFGLYWFVCKKNLKLQNFLLLASSYIFYGFWDWRFLALLVGSSAITYYLGPKIAETHGKTKKIYLNTGLVLAIGTLFYFKYFGFFIDSFADLFDIKNKITLSIILPLGISFYTFRIVSYFLDIKNNKLKPETDALALFNYIAFFPSMTSGPIDKGGLLLPQLKKERIFKAEDGADAARQILYGAFKKLVVANSITPITQGIFQNYEAHSGSTVAFGAILFLFELYADFSGYSDMAVGFARLLGFKITKNFAFPLFAQNIAEYWRKWHISLTSWLTEYVFTPLVIQFRDYGKRGLIAAIILNFILIGAWHGPRFTFVLFGLLHGLYYIPLIVKDKLNKKKKITGNFPTLTELGNILLTMVMVCFALVLFAAPDLKAALGMYGKIFSISLFSVPQFIKIKILGLIGILILIDWMNKDQEHGLDVKRLNPLARRGLYVFLIFLIMYYGVFSNGSYIYEQF